MTYPSLDKGRISLIKPPISGSLIKKKEVKTQEMDSVFLLAILESEREMDLCSFWPTRLVSYIVLTVNLT